MAADDPATTEREVARVLVSADGPVRLAWSAVGPGISADQILPPALNDRLRGLKAAMAVPGRGAWFSFVMVVQSDGAYEVAYDWDREVFWLSDDLYQEMDDLGRSPSDEYWQAELLRFPRRTLPPWLAARRVAVSVAPSPDRAALVGRPGWSRLWSSIPIAAGARLCTPSYWPHGLDALIAEVTEDLGGLLRGGTVGQLQQLARGLVATGLAPELDLSADSPFDLAGGPAGSRLLSLVEPVLGGLVDYFLRSADLLAYRRS